MTSYVIVHIEIVLGGTHFNLNVAVPLEIDTCLKVGVVVSCVFPGILTACGELGRKRCALQTVRAGRREGALGCDVRGANGKQHSVLLTASGGSSTLTGNRSHRCSII